MRLLFAYFDFDGQYGMGECGLNFSTTENYSVKKNKEGTEIVYTLSKTVKPKEEQLPLDFWGNERLYNITALVGDNGAGKTTLLHHMLRVLTSGINLRLPFIFVLGETESNGQNAQIIYYQFNASRFTPKLKVSNNLENVNKTTEYPTELRKLKIILLDNTLSLSSIDLERNPPIVQTIEGYSDIRENEKQLYNRTVASAIRQSRDITYHGKQKPETIDVMQTLFDYFTYESYQEIRTLFDASHWKLLESLRTKKLPVPNPKYLTVAVEPPEELCKNYFKVPQQPWKKTNDNYFSKHFCESLSFCIFFEMNEQIETEKEKITENQYETGPNQIEKNYGINIRDVPISTPEDIEKIVEKWENTNSQRLTEIEIKRDITPFRDLLEFLKEKQQTLDQLFVLQKKPREPDKDMTKSEDTWIYYRNEYIVDIERTIHSEELRSCLMRFLQLYRAVTEHVYFLSFVTGLSSGEKHLLRMFTQLRYALASQNQGTDGEALNYAEAGNRPNLLQNKFKTKDKKEHCVPCDTVFLFLDEADLTYHPEWQRQFIHILAEYLPGLYKDPYDDASNRNGKDNSSEGCKDIQVILATHSPLMLSDFPKASTVYLKRDASTGNLTRVVDRGERCSFGENLYTILRDDFFMEDAVGDFAKHKINEIAKWCGECYSELQKPHERNAPRDHEEQKQERDKCAKELENHRKSVNLLAPGIIRNKLNAELDGCERLLGSKYEIKTLEAEEKRLQERMDLIKKKLATLGGNDASDT